MSVSGELLCSFELLKPLDSSALKNHIKKGRNKRNSILNSPVSFFPVTWSRLGTDVVGSLQRYLLKAFDEERCVLDGRKGNWGWGCFVIELEKAFYMHWRLALLRSNLFFPTIRL